MRAQDRDNLEVERTKAAVEDLKSYLTTAGSGIYSRGDLIRRLYERIEMIGMEISQDQDLKYATAGASEYIDLLERVAEARGDESVPRDFIVQALEMVESGEVDVNKYPSKVASLKAIYDLAVKLHKGQMI